MTPFRALWMALAASALAAAALWNKANSFLLGDLPWWVSCVARYARGEMPYRDYQWSYPPLSLYLFGGAMQTFGERFWVLETLLCLLSLAIVVLLWDLLRGLLPPALLAGALLSTIAMGATTQTFFSLFSLMSYSPALHLAMVGLLLVLRGVHRYPRSDWSAVPCLIGGFWIALLAKQECWLAAPALFGVLILRHGLHSLRNLLTLCGLGLACVLPPVFVMARLGSVVGWSHFKTGLQGYGLAGTACPWWPTGIGLFGMGAAIGLGCFAVFLGSLLERRRWIEALGPRAYAALAVAAVAGIAIDSVYIYRQVAELWQASIPLSNKIRESSVVAFSVTSVWRSAIWGALLAIVVLGWRWWRTRQLDEAGWGDLGLLTLLAAIASRGLFGSTIMSVPEVPALAYPLVIPAGTLLLWRTLSSRMNPGSAQAYILAVVLGYALLRVGGGWSLLGPNLDYGRVETAAGPIWVKHAEDHRKVLDFIERHSKAGEGLLELPYGGGMSFLTGRRSPAYSTLFRQVPMPEEFLQRDLEQIRKNPPGVVVGMKGVRFGTFWGTIGALACPFPSLVWISSKPAWDLERVNPSAQYIVENYRVAEEAGEWLLLVPSNPAPAFGR